MPISQAFIEQQVHLYQTLDKWFNSPQGLWVSESFCEVLSAYCPMIRGDNLLQLGLGGSNAWLNKFSFMHKWIVIPYNNPSMSLMSSITQLPLAKESIDCIIVPFGMDVLSHHHALLDELDRILKPSGHLIILGLNGFSLWGIASKLKLYSAFPLGLKQHSSFKLNRACMARGYQQIALENFGYMPPVQSKASLNRFFFMEEIGKMLWFFPANFYCYIAKKQQLELPLRPAKEYVIAWESAVN